MDEIEKLLAHGEPFKAEGVDYVSNGVEVDENFITINAETVKEG